MQKMKKYRIPRKIKKKIPQGQYCYEVVGKGSKWNEEAQQNLPTLKIKKCLFSFKNHFGYNDCKYLFNKDGIFNGEQYLDLCLEDQCKSCSINDKINKNDIR